MNAPRPIPFDLFVSYAHEDNRAPHEGKVMALVDAIRARHREAFPNDPLEDFFDVKDIVTGEYWKAKIFTGLEQSAVMVAILSPAYFKSEWCRREWEAFTQLELQRTYPGEAISPIYVLRHPDFDADESKLLDAWLRDLKNRQYVEWLPYFPHGAAALQEREVRARLERLHDAAWERVKKIRRFRRQPWNVPTEKNQIFVGREDELREVNERLMTRQTVGVTAVSGLGGIGKTTLAFRYAQRFRDHYPGGVLYLSCDGLTLPEDLRARLLDLAPHLFRWPDMNADERAAAEQTLHHLAQVRKQDEDRAYLQFKAQLEAGDRKLLIFDNVTSPAVLGAAARKLLPAPQNVRQLFTTRVGADDLGGLDTVTLGLLDPADALELLFRWRAFPRDVNDPEYAAACRNELVIVEYAIVSRLPPGEGPKVRDDAEWKAALAIVNRVQLLTIAVEVIGVHLWLHPELSYRAYLEGMERKGIGAKLNDAGRDAKVKQWIKHPETLMGPLLEPTLEKLSPLALRALEHAAFLQKDHIAIDWLRTLLEADEDYRPLLRHDADDPDPWLDALRLLGDRQLLHSAPDAGTAFPLARMHKVVQEVLIARLKEKGRDKTRQELLAEHLRCRAVSIYRSQQSPNIRELDVLLMSMPHLIASNAIPQLAYDAMMLHDKVVAYRNLSAAQSLLNVTHAVIGGHAEADPGNAERQRDLSVSLNKLGNLAVAQGNLSDAQRFYGDSFRIRQPLAESDPDNTASQRDLSVSLIRLGSMAVAHGNLPEAQSLFTKSLHIRQRLAESDPTNAAWQRDLAVSLNKLGEVAVAQGNLPEAQRLFADCLHIAQCLAESDPGNSRWQYDLGISNERLGDLAFDDGDLQTAETYQRRRFEIIQRLAQADPGNARWQRDLSVALERLGELTVAQGDLPEGERLFGDCLRIRECLAESDSDNTAWQRDLAYCCTVIGQLLMHQEKWHEAWPLLEKSLAIAERLSAFDRSNVQWQEDVRVSRQLIDKVRVQL